MRLQRQGRGLAIGSLDQIEILRAKTGKYPDIQAHRPRPQCDHPERLGKQSTQLDIVVVRRWPAITRQQSSHPGIVRQCLDGDGVLMHHTAQLLHDSVGFRLMAQALITDGLRRQQVKGQPRRDEYHQTAEQKGEQAELGEADAAPPAPPGC